ncbi:pre-16S rRNA-processing nuclease YqgF [Sporomusa sp.]|uniref:pre-16S rRNA-processing nuclease YqgF n=1 Tax=Sporomusa sp. TaxID=2078658 RepID=UPI002CE195E3|nr:pre-16S rRNA-processing nuclease YqgF [Sporomusa sp.]HWR05925.1 pre-16S rRNA-processing nuclease YqgF [Sporomusa sp.]
MSADLVLAIDPGREKCGIAVVHKEQGLIYKTIITTAELFTIVNNLAAAYNLTTVIIGDGTTTHTAQTALATITVNGQGLKVIPVNEYRSTDEARLLYWVNNPPRGLKRLIPTSMQVPPVPVDDFVAVILAERYFKGL